MAMMSGAEWWPHTKHTVGHPLLLCLLLQARLTAGEEGGCGVGKVGRGSSTLQLRPCFIKEGNVLGV